MFVVSTQQPPVLVEDQEAAGQNKHSIPQQLRSFEVSEPKKMQTSRAVSPYLFMYLMGDPMVCVCEYIEELCEPTISVDGGYAFSLAKVKTFTIVGCIYLLLRSTVVL